MKSNRTQIVKNIKISQQYGVSRPTVGKWIDNALSGKNNLQLAQNGGRYYIIDNLHNTAEITRLKEHGIKYRNKTVFEAVQPTREFYRIFKPEEIHDLISTLEFDKYIPLKYTNYGEGDIYWERFIDYNTRRHPHSINQSIDMLETALSYLDYLVKDKETINVVEIGPGYNNILSKTLEHFVSLNKTITYTCVGNTKNIVDNALKFAQKEYPRITKTGIIVDIEKGDLQKTLFDLSLNPQSCTLIFYLTGALELHSQQIHFLSDVRAAMGSQDYLIINNSIDTPAQRTSFDVFQSTDFKNKMSWILKTLGITPEMYEEEFVYNEKTNEQIFTITITKDIDIHFNLTNGIKTLHFNAHDTIHLWRHQSWQPTTITQLFDEAGLGVIYQSLTVDQDHALVCAVKQKTNTHK